MRVKLTLKDKKLAKKKEVREYVKSIEKFYNQKLDEELNRFYNELMTHGSATLFEQKQVIIKTDHYAWRALYGR